MASRPDVGVAGRLLVDGRLTSGVVEVTGGRIVGIRKTTDAEEVHDFGDAIILPGGVDMHVHFRDPGWPSKEDFGSGSASAVHGGITTVLDMPNTDPMVVDRETLLDKARQIDGRSWTDYGLACALMADHDPADVSDLALCYKVFMAATTGVAGGGFDVAFHRAVGVERPIVVHAEDPGLLRTEPGRDLTDHLRARPSKAEVEAIRETFRLATHQSPPPSLENEDREVAVAPDFWIHIAHVSASGSVDVVRDLRRYGFTAEVSPHHLFLDVSMDLGAYGKVNPPLRTVADRTALWDALRVGVIDAVASDHAPHLPEEKEMDFEEAPAGIPGVETTYPLMIRAARHGLIPLQRVVEAMATRPAEILGLPKGRLEVGLDADLAIFDPTDEVEIDPDRLHSRCGWTPYRDMAAVFPVATVVGGRLCVRDGALFGDPGGVQHPRAGPRWTGSRSPRPKSVDATEVGRRDRSRSTRPKVGRRLEDLCL